MAEDTSNDFGAYTDEGRLQDTTEANINAIRARQAEEQLAEIDEAEDVGEVSVPGDNPEFVSDATNASPTGAISMRSSSKIVKAVPDGPVEKGRKTIDFGDTINDLPGMQALGGTVDGVAQFFNSIQDVGNFITGSEDSKEQWGDFIPTVAEGKGEGALSGANQPIRAMSAFVTDFVGAGKFTKFLGIFKKGPVKKSMLDGMIADFTAFDPDEGDLSNLIQQNPTLANPVNEFLATRKEDPRVVNRLKMALEGAGLGAFIESFTKILRVYRDRRHIDKLKKYRSESGFKDEPLIFPNEGASPKARKNLRDQARNKEAKAFNEGRQANTEGFQKDIKKRFGINWNRIDSSDDMKQVWAKFRKMDEEELFKAADGLTREDVVRQAKGDIANNPKEALADVIAKEPDQATRKDRFIARIMESSSILNIEDLSTKVLDGSVPKEELERAILMHWQLGRKTQALKADASRTLSDLSENVDATQQASQAFSDDVMGQLSKAGMDVKDFDGMRIAEMVSALPSTAARKKLLQDVNGPSGLHMFQELWISALLSGPKTHLTNMTSNTLANLNEFVLEKFIRATMSSVRRASPDERTFFGEIPAAFFSFRETMRESMKMAKIVWKGRKTNSIAVDASLREQGSPGLGGVKLEGFKEPTANVANLNKLIRRNQRKMGTPDESLSGIDESAYFAKMMNGAYQLYRDIGGAALMSSDAFFKSMAYRMQINSSAYKAGKAKGLKDTELVEFIMKERASPSNSIKLEAQDMAEYLTFTKALGSRGKAVQAVIEANPELRFVLPFVRTPLNLNKYTFERLPGLNFLVKESREAFTNGLRSGATKAQKMEMEKATARLAMGSLVASYAWDMAQSGMLTGSGPVGSGAKQSRDVLRAANVQENSLVAIDDSGNQHFYAIGRVDGFGTIMTLMADLHNFSKDVDEDTFEEASLALSIAISRQLLSKTWATNARQLFDGVLAPESNTGAYWKGMFGTIVPRLVSQMGDFIDPTVLETRTLFDQIKKGLPKKFGEQKLDILAKPQNKDGSLYGLLSPFSHKERSKDPLANELVKIGLPLNTVDNKIHHKGVVMELSARQENFIKKQIIDNQKNPSTNLSFRETMERIVQGRALPGPRGPTKIPYQKDRNGEKISDDEKGKIWQKYYNAYKDMVMDGVELRSKFPELVQRIREEQLANIEKQTGRSINPQGGFNLRGNQ